MRYFSRAGSHRILSSGISGNCCLIRSLYDSCVTIKYVLFRHQWRQTVVGVLYKCNAFAEYINKLFWVRVVSQLPPPWPGVRHPQDHLACGGDQARLEERAAPGQPRRGTRLGLRAGLRGSDVADAAARHPGGLRDRDGRGALGARVLEVAFDEADLGDFERYVTIDPAFVRPAEVDHLIGDPSKAERDLGWKPQTSFEELIRLMTRADLELLAPR